ncbi:MAG: CDP-alcohol phosphatidyltransferase family protein [Bacteroidales bacterium]|nr:CDP-alcohol phosphatidyltransferase family protein [Bacteroidales bacterium]
MENQKQAVRIQTSILNAAEKKALVWMASRLPRWVTSDMMTFTGFLGACIIALGCILSNQNILWLWLSCFGLLVNWFGDSLDGTIARVRNQQRPRYGFFLDHNIDCINEAIMFTGVGLSPLMNLNIALMVLAVYLMLSVYVYINSHLKGEFKLTYAKMGPTEFRLIIMIALILFMYVPGMQAYAKEVVVFGTPVTFRILDYIALVILVILLGAYLVSLFKDGRYFAALEPLEKNEED